MQGIYRWVHLVSGLSLDCGWIEVPYLPPAGSRVQLSARDGTTSLDGRPERIEIVRVRAAPLTGTRVVTFVP
jgi:hypothetical protein